MQFAIDEKGIRTSINNSIKGKPYKCPIYKECEFFYDRDYFGVPDILVLAFKLIKRQKAKIDEIGAQ